MDKILEAKFLLPMLKMGIAEDYINGSVAVDHTRAVKDAQEIALMKKSSKINDQAMALFKKLPHEGCTEKELADQTLAIYQSLGAEAFSFEPIVAFGKNAADPHHMPDNTVLKEGDAVLFDAGCRYQNYCSDMTRTFFYKKEPDEIQKKIYNLVRRANEAAEEYVRPGVRLCDIDAKARDIITAGGYGADFTHRLGHFIGIQDHATVTYVAMDKHNNVAKASQQITSQASAKAEPTNEAPKITMSAAKATIGVYDDFSMLDYVASITDDTDDSTYLKAHLLVDGTPNENAAGTYQLSCYVYDSQGSKSNVEKFTLTRQ